MRRTSLRITTTPILLHCMTFGSYTIDTLETGRFRLDGGAMFGVVPKTLWSRGNPADDRNRIEMTMRTLVLRARDRIVLVDTGVGRKLPDKQVEIYDIDFRTHELAHALTECGIAPEAVTDVILTHAHFDHIGGCTVREGDALELQFPNATHYLQHEHWQWALAPSERDRASFLPENYLPIEEAGRLALVDGDVELFDGLHLECVQGHTFAQQLVRLVDGDRSLVFCADLIPMRAHVPAPWIMGYDLQPLVTLREKIAALRRAAERRDILVFEHDPFTEAATVIETERGFAVHNAGTLDALLAMGDAA